MPRLVQVRAGDSFNNGVLTDGGGSTDKNQLDNFATPPYHTFTMKHKPSWNELAPYAGRWVALIGDCVVGVGWTAAEARRAAQRNRPKERITDVIFVPAVEMDDEAYEDAYEDE